MESILWYQKSEIVQQDGFVIDGKHQYTTDSDVHQAAFSTLRNARKWPSAKYISLWKNIYPGASSQISIYFGREGEIMIQSHFKDRDEIGRLIPYMFYSKDGDTAREKLTEYGQIVGLEPNENDLIILEKSFNLHRNRAIAYLGGAIVIGIIALAIWK